MPKKPIPIGQRFNRLTVMSAADSPDGEQRVRCRCECGSETVTRLTYLKNGHTKSCGCAVRESMRAVTFKRLSAKNRETRSPEYHAWQGMKARCLNPDSTSYRWYGGRGIRVCDAWANSFQQFLADVGRRPSSAHSLDRIDVNGCYEPQNVRWATWTQQQSNKRVTRMVTFHGETLPLAHWATRAGLLQSTLQRRIVKLGWPIEKALTTPASLYHHR